MSKYTPAQYRARLRRLQNEVENVNDTVLKSAAWGAKKASMMAPRDTYALIRSIGYKKSKNNVAWINQKNPGKLRPNNQGQPFNYAEYIYYRSQGSASGKYHVKRGRLDYMAEAARQSRKKFKTDVRAHVTRAIKITR